MTPINFVAKERRARWIRKPTSKVPGIVELTIPLKNRKRPDVCRYHFREIPIDPDCGKRAVEWEKLVEGGEVRHVRFVEVERDGEVCHEWWCCCPGFERWGKCRHADATPKILESLR